MFGYRSANGIAVVGLADTLCGGKEKMIRFEVNLSESAFSAKGAGSPDAKERVPTDPIASEEISPHSFF